MGRFEQGGAHGALGDFSTKKALKEQIGRSAESVHLYSTSAFGGFEGKADELPVGVVFNVVGPNPYTSRKWYASVEMTQKGLKVS